MRESITVHLRHHSLVAWQRADDLFIELHTLTIRSFPAFERFELGSQLRKAAYSVAANIAEGFGRRQRGDRLRFLNVAEGRVPKCHIACTRLRGSDTSRTRTALRSKPS